MPPARRAVVVGGSSPAARAVTTVLAGHDWSVDTVESMDGPQEGSGFPAGPLDLVVHAAPPPLTTPARLVDLDDDEWDAACELVLRSTLHTLQAAHRTMAAHRTRPGAIVVVVPSLALTGAARFAPWSAAAEGQRTMVKAAARQWGADGITVNAVSVPADVLVSDPPPELAGLALSVQAPAFARSDPLEDLASLVLLVTRPEAARLTGATLAADGGEAMAP